MTPTATIAITAGPEVLSASGPAIRIGIRLAALTMDARTPKTRPRTAASMFSKSVVFAFCAGAAYAATTVSAQTALFENMPAEVRGRVFGVLATIVSAASLIAVLIAGPLADAISAPVVIAVTAVGVVALAAWSAIVFGPRPRIDGTRA